MVLEKAIKVEVLVNGSAAQEYNGDDDESNGPNTVTKYIEALSGAEFEVHYELKPFWNLGCQHLVFVLSIDGKSIDSSVSSKEGRDGNAPRRTGSFQGIQKSQGETCSIERFRFSDIKISDDETQNANTNLKVEAAKIGTISLKLHRANKGVYYKPGIKGSGQNYDELTELGTLHEKALKGQALSHCTSLGSPQITWPRGSMSGVEFVDSQDKPYVVFNFRYRSRSAYSKDIIPTSNAKEPDSPEALQDLHIIPRTPIPVSLEERPVEELSIDEARELLRRQRERQASIIAQQKSENRPERGIKREYENDEEYNALLGSARANKVPRMFEKGEVINLLED